MSKFGDELRAAPKLAEEERKKRIAEKTAMYTKNYNDKQRHILNDVLCQFKKECMDAAKKGSHSIVYKPTPQNCRSQAFRIGMGTLADRLLFSGNTRKEAENLIPSIESELSQMGLRSYQISTYNVQSVYPTEFYIGFRISATW